jgi:hypothetical protein
MSNGSGFSGSMYFALRLRQALDERTSFRRTKARTGNPFRRSSNTETEPVRSGAGVTRILGLFTMAAARSVLAGVNDGGCQAAFREIPSHTYDDLLEGRSQDEMEPERRRLAAAFHLGNTLVEKRECLRCLVSDLYNGKASAFEVRRHLIPAGKETLLGRRGPGHWVLWFFSAG